MPVIPRKPRTTRYVRKGSRGVARPAYNSVKQSVPLRFKSGRKSYKKNRRYMGVSTGVVEKKLSALTDYNESLPSAIAIGAQAFKWYGVMGAVAPSTWSGGFNTLGGFEFPQGTGNNDRDGRYMFLNKTSMTLSVHMNASPRLSAPVQFRMIIFRARRVTTPTGVSYDPNLRLMLKPNGDAFGAGTGGINFNDLYFQPTNKRDWIIVGDKKFTLSPFLEDGTLATAAWQGKYPNFKLFRLSLNHMIKSSFSNVDNQPDDYDYKYGVAIFAGCIGRDQFATGWEVNLRGTTSAIDS